MTTPIIIRLTGAVAIINFNINCPNFITAFTAAFPIFFNASCVAFLAFSEIFLVTF